MVDAFKRQELEGATQQHVFLARTDTWLCLSLSLFPSLFCRSTTSMTSLPLITLSSPDAASNILRAAASPGPGFFYLASHGIPAALIDAAFAASAELFLDASAEAMREKERSVNRSENTGWTPLEQET